MHPLVQHGRVSPPPLTPHPAPQSQVTLDSSDWLAILRGLRDGLEARGQLGSVRLGVGTVMDDSVGVLHLAADAGATFALSPIDPMGFVDECHRLGLLPVPSAFTSNEWWALHRRGVRLIKWFHAGLASPKLLRSMLSVSPLANLHILPSGGVNPSNAAEWLDAGAAAVGMGSNLVGKELSVAEGMAAYEAAAADWAAQGREAARALFSSIKRATTKV